MANKFFILMFFSLSLDFKGEDGGSFLIYTMTAIGLISGIAVILINGFPQYESKFEFFLGFASMMPILTSFIPMLFGDLEFDSFARNALPYIFLTVAFHAIVTVDANDMKRLASSLFWAALISICFTFVYGLLSSGQGLLEIRYQVISSYTAGALSFCVTEYLYRENIRISRFFALSLILIVSFIAVTRSYALAVVGSLLFTIIASKFSSVQPLRRISIFSTSVVVLTIVLASYILVPDYVTRWVDRAFSVDVGYDITELTRLAEIESQISSLFYSVNNFLFGKGIGGIYVWSDRYTALLKDFINEADLYGQYSFVGHNFWVYSVFSNGIAIGLLLPLAIVLSTTKALILVVSKKPINIKIYWMSISVFAFFVYTLIFTIGGNPMGNRSSGMLLGVFFGFLCLLERRSVLDNSD
jgi:hypothetical protein